MRMKLKHPTISVGLVKTTATHLSELKKILINLSKVVTASCKNEAFDHPNFHLDEYR